MSEEDDIEDKGLPKLIQYQKDENEEKDKGK